MDRSLVGELSFLSIRRRLWLSVHLYATLVIVRPSWDDFTLDRLPLGDFVRLFARRLDLACYEDLVPIGVLKRRSIP